MINIKKLSTSYQTRRLTSKDVDKAFALVQSNPTYFAYCPPQPTRHSMLEDMQVVPANKTNEDKFYLGFFEGTQLIAILDLINQYPDAETGWIGFFMVDAKYQKKGIGSAIIKEVFLELKAAGLKVIELDYPKGDAQSEHFLLKNNFQKTGREISVPGYTVVIMNYKLETLS